MLTIAEVSGLIAAAVVIGIEQSRLDLHARS
jgi:hypothetical protein